MFEWISSLLFLFVIFSPVIIPIAALLYMRIRYEDQRKKYESSVYYATTPKPFAVMRKDLGLQGEYMISQKLCELAGYKKFLFNCYLPKEDGSLSETDVILLHTSGIFVFESKNYSGWIFGTESQKQWTQTFKNGHKEKFYNPLMQNNSHIKWLKRYLPEISEDAFHSVIVFGDRCSFKKISLTTNKHLLIHQSQLFAAMQSVINNQVFSNETIDILYQKLFPLTQTNDPVKFAHMMSVRNYKQQPTKVTSLASTHQLSDSLSPEPNSKVPFCSKCGAKMTLKTARRGERIGKQFWGCPNFPSCRNIINIESEFK